MKIKLSIISPVYKAEAIVDELVKRIKEEASEITADFEIILVEDGGPDRSWEKIKKNCEKDQRVKGIKLSRNFGQHYAISAGLEASKGEYVIVMDCDLQDNPKYFRELFKKAEQGVDIVYTIKEERSHGSLKNITANMFYWLFNYLVDNNLQGSDKVGSYSLLTRKVVEAYLSVGDYRKHYLMVLRWLGFNYDFIKIEHAKRFEGKSSYTIKKLINHALDGITSQSDKLLRLTAGFGLILSLISFLAALTIIVLYLVQPFQAGWPSIMVLILLTGGLIILSVGICGIYIGKIFEQSKNRPLYLIEKKENL